MVDCLYIYKWNLIGGSIHLYCPSVVRGHCTHIAKLLLCDIGLLVIKIKDTRLTDHGAVFMQHFS